MSVILDALKKVQDARKKGPIGLAVSAPPVNKSRGLKPLYLVLGGVVCIVLVLFIVSQLFLSVPSPGRQKVPENQPPLPKVASLPNPAQPPVVVARPEPSQPDRDAGGRRLQPAGIAPHENKLAPRPIRKRVPAMVSEGVDAGSRTGFKPASTAARTESLPPKVFVEKINEKKILDLFNSAVRTGEQGNAGEAKRLYLEILSEKPGYLEALNNLGVLFLKEGKTKEAVFYFRSSLEYKKDYAKAYNNMGLAMTQEGQTEQAAEYFGKAIELEPGSVEPYLNLSTLLRNEGRLDEALSPLQMLIDKKIRDATVFLSYALLKDQKGDIQKATKYYRYYLNERGNSHYRAKVIERLKVLEEYRPAGDR